MCVCVYCIVCACTCICVCEYFPVHTLHVTLSRLQLRAHVIIVMVYFAKPTFVRAEVGGRGGYEGRRGGRGERKGRGEGVGRM